MNGLSVDARNGYADKTHGISIFVRIWPRDSGDRDGKGGGGSDQRSFRHRNGDLTADRAFALEESSGDPERFALVGLGIGDEAAVQTFGGAGSLGQKRGQLSGGAGFSGNDGHVSLRRDF